MDERRYRVMVPIVLMGRIYVNDRLRILRLGESGCRREPRLIRGGLDRQTGAWELKSQGDWAKAVLDLRAVDS